MQLPEIRLGGKFSQIYQNERHFFRKIFVFVIFQRHVLHELVTPLQVWQPEIHENDGDYLRELVLPVALPQRTADGSRRVGDDTVADELLARLLHLHDDALVLLRAAIDIVNQPLLLLQQSQLLRRTIDDVPDGSDILLQKGVEEKDEVLLVGLRSEKPLEPEVGQQVDGCILGKGAFDNYVFHCK